MSYDPRVNELEARVELLRDMVRQLIAHMPGGLTSDMAMQESIRSFNVKSQSLEEPQKTARNQAATWFAYGSIHRTRQE